MSTFNSQSNTVRGITLQLDDNQDTVGQRKNPDRTVNDTGQQWQL